MNSRIKSVLILRQSHWNVWTQKMDFTWAIHFSDVFTFITPAWDYCILHNLPLHNFFFFCFKATTGLFISSCNYNIWSRRNNGQAHSYWEGRRRFHNERFHYCDKRNEKKTCTHTHTSAVHTHMKENEEKNVHIEKTKIPNFELQF